MMKSSNFATGFTVLILIGFQLGLDAAAVVTKHQQHDAFSRTEGYPYPAARRSKSSRVKSPRFLKVRTTPAPTPEEVDGLAETQELLAQGEHKIVLDPSYKDVILMMGNTGAGKTTITKFLTKDNAELVSYEGVDGHFLIKDITDSKISENSTLVSKSIFPDLLIEPTTDTAFYDYPGFSDTRSASVEIANAYFMKKVADFADSVKILFVVNYNSLKIGQNRLDFKNMMDHALHFIKNPAKFSSGIALIATRVEYAWTDEKLIRGIAKFLESVYKDLPIFFKEPVKLQNARDLINAFLIRDEESGNYTRIGLFRQPDQLGPLDEIETTQSCKALLEEIIWENIEYVPKSADDFGVTISPKAKLLVKNLAEKYNENLGSVLQVLGSLLIKEGTKKSVEDSSGFGFTDFFQVTEKIKGMSKLIERLGNTTNRPEFLTELLEGLQTDLDLGGSNPEISAISQNISKIDETLDFFVTTLDESIQAQPIKWIQPLKKAQNRLIQHLYQISQNISERIEDSFITLSQKLNASIGSKLQPSSSISNFEILAEIDDKSRFVKRLKENILKSSTIQDVFDTTRSAIAELNMVLGSNTTTSSLSIFSLKGINIPLKQDIGEKPSPFSTDMVKWTQPLGNLEKFLHQTEYSTSSRINRQVQSSMDKLGAELIRIYKFDPAYKFQPNPNSNVDPENPEASRDLNNIYEQLTREFDNLYSTTAALKGVQHLSQFSQEVAKGVRNSAVGSHSSLTTIVQTLPSESSLSSTKNIDLFAPVNGKTSPFKLQEWLHPLENVLIALQTKITQMARKLGETANEQKLKELSDERNAMAEKLSKLAGTMEELAERQEEERRAWRQREDELRESFRNETKKRDEDFRELRKQQIEQFDKMYQESRKREDELREQNLQMTLQLINAQNDRDSKFGQILGGVITAGLGAMAAG